jgi:hypothetical protein
MKVVEGRSAADVFGVAGQRGNPAIERLSELGDHEGPVNGPSLKRGEQGFQIIARRASASASPWF